MASPTVELVGKASDTLAQMRARLVAEYVRQAKAVYGTLTPGDWWNDAVITAVAGRLAMMELAMLQQAWRAGISYADMVLNAMGVTPKGVGPAFSYPRVNTDPWIVAMRPAMQYRHLQAQRPDVKPKSWPDRESDIGKVVEGWLNDAYSLLEDEALTDATSASNQSSVERYDESDVKAYRRIIHPERSQTGSCGLCIAASDRYYYTSELLPLHQRCKCTTAPIIGKNDPGLTLTQQDLDDLYGAAYTTVTGREYSSGRRREYTQTSRQALSNVRVKTISHGELGPLLTRGDTKTDGTAPAWEPPTAVMTQGQIKRMYDHATEFAKQYEALQKSDQDWLDFRYDGRSYTFRKSAHTNEARRWNLELAQRLQSLVYAKAA